MLDELYQCSMYAVGHKHFYFPSILLNNYLLPIMNSKRFASSGRQLLHYFLLLKFLKWKILLHFIINIPVKWSGIDVEFHFVLLFFAIVNKYIRMSYKLATFCMKAKAENIQAVFLLSISILFEGEELKKSS